MMTKLEELKEVLAASTPGEWVVDHWKDAGDGQNGGTIHVGRGEFEFIPFENIVLEVDSDDYVKSVGLISISSPSLTTSCRPCSMQR